MDNAVYLFAAFLIIWALVFGFIITMFFRQRRLNREIEALREMHKKQAEKAD